jgi:hypothetical protein
MISPVALSTFWIGPRPFFQTVCAGFSITRSVTVAYTAGISTRRFRAGFTRIRSFSKPYTAGTTLIRVEAGVTTTFSITVS